MVASRYPFRGQNSPAYAGATASAITSASAESSRSHVSPASPVTSIDPPRSPTSSRSGCPGSAASAYGMLRSAGSSPHRSIADQPFPRDRSSSDWPSPRLWAAYGPGLIEAYHTSGSAGAGGGRPPAWGGGPAGPP